jgi:hypothetical protein
MPESLRARERLPEGASVETVEYRGWKGYKNGALLRIAEGHFEVLVTMDDNLPDQQDLQQFGLAVAILRARSKEGEEAQGAV